MTPELAYFLKINVGIALFYAFYRLFFYKDTFFQWRRTALLGFFILSLVYPLMNLQEWIKDNEPMVAMADLYANVVLPEFVIEEQAQTTDWKSLLLSSGNYLYFGGVALLLLRFLIQFSCIIRLRISCRSEKVQGVRIRLLPHEAGPFSFFHWIFVHPASHTDEEMGEILTHELTHARQHHSVDVIISELMCIGCWFNPFVWLMKREVRSNLEYMADHRVIQTGYDHQSYQFHLLGLAHQKAAANLSNSFNVLPLKNRIKMMNKKRTKEIGRTKYLIFLPLAALLMIISNIEAVARTTKSIAKEVVQVMEQRIEAPSELPANFEQVPTAPQDKKKVDQEKVKATSTDQEEPLFEVVEEMPDFPGGMVRLMEYLATNLRYPGEAHAKGVQGRVIVLFIVEKDGSISHPKVVKSVNPDLDAEALRVISTMPKWKPGRQKGKDVRVKYTVPVMFRLKDEIGVKAEEIKQSQLEEVVAVGYMPTDEVVPTPDTPIFEVVEQMPKFPGGASGIMNYLARNIKYPARAQESKKQGRVIVQIVIDKEGNVTDPRVVNSVSPLLDAEAIRVVSNMPKWEPGMQRGQKVSVRYTLPIVFRLQPIAVPAKTN